MTIDVGVLGQNPPDPAEVVAWNTRVANPAEHSGTVGGGGFNVVGEVSDIGQAATWTMDSHPAWPNVVRIPVPQDTDVETGITHNAIPIFYAYVPWPDGDHSTTDAFWIHNLGARENPGDVIYIRHGFWVPSGAVAPMTTPSLQFAAVDIMREIWCNGTLLYSSDQDYNSAFFHYAAQTLSFPDGVLQPGQWNLLAFKVQKSVNVVSTIFGNYFNNRQPYDVYWDGWYTAPVDNRRIIAVYQAQIAGLQQSIDDLQALADRVAGWSLLPVENTTAEIGELQARIAAVQLLIEGEQTTIDGDEALIALYTSQIAGLEASIEDIQAAIIIISALPESPRKDQALNEAGAQIAQLELQIAALQEQISELQAEIDLSQDRINADTEEIAALEDQITALEARQEELDTTARDALLALIAARISSVQAGIALLEMKIAALPTTIILAENRLAEDELLTTLSAPFGATQFKFRMLTTHTGRFTWNDFRTTPDKPDLSDWGLIYGSFNMGLPNPPLPAPQHPVFAGAWMWRLSKSESGTRLEDDGLGDVPLISFELANNYWGGIVAPAAYAPGVVTLSDMWLLRPQVVDPPQLCRSYLWDVAWHGPVHQHAGASFRLDASIQVPTLGDIVQVYVTAGSNTAYLLTGGGQVFGFGSGFGGALGQGDEADHYAMPPVTIDCDGQPVQKIMGGSGDTFSMFAVTYNGELWGWGLDELLLQSIGEQTSPVRVLPAQFRAGSVYDVTVSAENVVFVRTTRRSVGSTADHARASAQIVG